MGADVILAIIGLGLTILASVFHLSRSWGRMEQAMIQLTKAVADLEKRVERVEKFTIQYWEPQHD